MKDRNYLINFYNATSSTDSDTDDIESYEHWLERQLIDRIDKLEKTHEKWEKGVCPKCGLPMFDKFSASIHDVDKCGNKKAVADNFECA